MSGTLCRCHDAPFDHAALLPMTATLHSERAGVKGGMQSASSRQATKSAGGGGTGGGNGGGGDGEDEDMLITRRRSPAASALSWHRVSGGSSHAVQAGDKIDK